MIGALKQVQTGRKVENVAREVGVSKHMIYGWKAKYGGMDATVPAGWAARGVSFPGVRNSVQAVLVPPPESGGGEKLKGCQRD